MENIEAGKLAIFTGIHPSIEPDSKVLVLDIRRDWGAAKVQAGKNNILVKLSDLKDLNTGKEVKKIMAEQQNVAKRPAAVAGSAVKQPVRQVGTKPKSPVAVAAKKVSVVPKGIRTVAIDDNTEVKYTSGLQKLITETSTPNQILDAAKSLMTNFSETYFTLGGILSVIHKSKTFKTLNYDGAKGFANYVENELKIEYRRAMHMISIYDSLTALGVDEVRAGSISFSNMKEIPNYITEENKDDLLNLAENSTHQQLVEILRTDYSATADVLPRGKKQKAIFSFRVEKADAKVIQAALDAAVNRNRDTEENISAAFLALCTEYLTLTEDSGNATLNSIQKLLKSRFNMKAVKLEDKSSPKATAAVKSTVKAVK